MTVLCDGFVWCVCGHAVVVVIRDGLGLVVQLPHAESIGVDFDYVSCVLSGRRRDVAPCIVLI